MDEYVIETCTKAERLFQLGHKESYSAEFASEAEETCTAGMRIARHS
jgi:hypothetical protein